MFNVCIEPHEREEAIEAYRDRLTPRQAEAISDAPDGALIRLYSLGPTSLEVTIIPDPN